jgi:hypothetical protein
MFKNSGRRESLKGSVPTRVGMTIIALAAVFAGVGTSCGSPNIVPAAASDDWAARDGGYYRENAQAFEEAVEFACDLASENDLPWDFVPLPDHLAPLTCNGAVLCRGFDQAEFVFFDLASSYPCSDGLIYGLLPDTAPDAALLLSDPVPVDSHWWVAVWDPVYLLDWAGSRSRDKATTFDDEYAERETDPATLDVPVETVVGEIRTFHNLEDTGAVLLYLDVGESKPHCILLNRYTTCHFPESWGPVPPSVGIDSPEVRFPPGMDGPLEGQQVSAVVKTVELPGSDRTQSFALEVTFAGD